MEIRNVAIVAHVDHGKTTLVDELLKESEKKDAHEVIQERAMDSGDLERERGITILFHEVIQERAMDSGDLERERGITILAKNTAIEYKNVKINILDTPGHADFGGEVERIMKMVDAVCLVVDAFEGVMPQTRFVLNKALQEGLKPIVVINKIDRTFARPQEVLDEVYELFMDLGASEEQLDFPILYASGIQGKAAYTPDLSKSTNMVPLLDTIVKYVKKPDGDPNGRFQFQPALFDYNEYVGRIGIGKIARGKVSQNQNVSVIRLDGKVEQFRIQKLLGFMGLDRIEVKEASAGDIVAIAGLGDINIGETICEVGFEEALEPLHIEKPTVQMTFSTNSSPLVGQEGKLVTASKIEERLFKETQKDVSLLVSRSAESEAWTVSGRGELHLSILIETMRREGYEFTVSRPEVIFKTENEVILEPYEYVTVDCPNDVVGNVIELLGSRKGILIEMNPHMNQVRLIYNMPSRGIIGLLTQFLTQTQGYGVLSHTFLDYRPVSDTTPVERTNGALVSISEGLTTAYAIGKLESRGALFVEPRTQVYEGMIVGEASKEMDLAVNIIQGKQLTNMRSSSKDSTVVLKRPREMGLEACMAFINDDELIEVTPKSIRLRKRILNTNERKKYDRRS